LRGRIAMIGLCIVLWDEEEGVFISYTPTRKESGFFIEASLVRIEFMWCCRIVSWLVDWLLIGVMDLLPYLEPFEKDDDLVSLLIGLLKWIICTTTFRNIRFLNRIIFC
jgi:hypothetical protein